MYNYSKTPSRGARDFLLDVDGLYLYMGSLLRADKCAPYCTLHEQCIECV